MGPSPYPQMNHYKYQCLSLKFWVRQAYRYPQWVGFIRTYLSPIAKVEIVVHKRDIFQQDVTLLPNKLRYIVTTTSCPPWVFFTRRRDIIPFETLKKESLELELSGCERNGSLQIQLTFFILICVLFALQHCSVRHIVVNAGRDSLPQSAEYIVSPGSSAFENSKSYWLFFLYSPKEANIYSAGGG